MTEAEWLDPGNSDRILDTVRPHLDFRRWRLLTANTIRFVDEWIPPDKIRKTFDLLEIRTGTPFTTAVAEGLLLDCRAALPAAVQWSIKKQRAIVASVDPDLCTETNQHAIDDNPPMMLYHAASFWAARSMESVQEATEMLVSSYLFHILSPSIQHRFDLYPELFNQVQESVYLYSILTGYANIQTATAFKLKELGDRYSEPIISRRKNNILASKAQDRIDFESEHYQYKEERLHSNKRERLTNWIGSTLHDMIGNPYQPLPNIEHNRSDDVIGLANTIDAEKRYDMMPILADALLEAGCDNSLIMNHCLHSGPHGRGCWVIDLILNRDVDFFAKVQVKKSKSRS